MMFLFEAGLIQTNQYDRECRLLADRHYSRRTVGASQFLPSGRKLVLRDTEGLVVFGWLWPEQQYRADGQSGFNCTIFRNESPRLSSEIILEAEAMAVEKWGPNRGYTYVNPRAVKSTNPGYCFKRAGWRFAGISTKGLHLLVKDAVGVGAP
jgi:hypothetical protein